VSLAERLSVVTPQSSCRRCGTCTWIERLSDSDRAAFDEWIGRDRSLTQLWEIAVNDPDQPYTLSLGAMRACVRAHVRDSQ
jgi:hypothetical protein